jgi:hypothetical protein
MVAFGVASAVASLLFLRAATLDVRMTTVFACAQSAAIRTSTGDSLTARR